MKRCSLCQEFKALDEFYRVSNSSSKHRSACKQCTNSANKAYVATEQGAQKKKQAAQTYRKNGGGKKRELTEQQKIAKSCSAIRRKYGITCEERDAILAKQNGRCANCKNKLTKQVIDHDHLTGKVRGILCYNCNVGIGLLGDSVEGLRQALSYLEEQNAYYSHINIT